jgi:hypothetical protein
MERAEGVALIPIWRGNMNNRFPFGWAFYCHRGPDFFGRILSLLFQGQPAQGKIPAGKETALIPNLIITQCNVEVGFCRQGSISLDGHFQNFSLN